MKSNKYWSRFASNYYGTWNRNESRKILNRIEQHLISNDIRVYAKNQIKAITDLGCGPGRIIDYFADQFNNAIIIGIDNNEKMIKICKKKYRTYPNIKVIKADIRNIPHRAIQKVDVVTCIRVLKYLPERQEIFSDISKILKPGGLFIFTITNRNSIAFFDTLPVQHYKDSITDIERNLRKNSFRLLQADGVQRFPEFLYSAFSHLGLVKYIYTFEAWFGRLFGSTTFAKTIYIAATKL